MNIKPGDFILQASVATFTYISYTCTQPLWGCNQHAMYPCVNYKTGSLFYEVRMESSLYFDYNSNNEKK